MLGKFQEAEINDAGFFLGDAHLAGFIALNEEKICALFGVNRIV